jgi:SAM-dependent methyltransferase
MEPINFNAVSDIYDSYVSVDFDIDFFLKVTEKYKTKEMLELMCGTGRVSIPLLEAGRRLTCVDYSRGMLDEFSRKINGKVFAVELVEMDVTTLDIGKQFDCIFLPFHSLSEIITTDKQLLAMQSVGRHLKEGGEFILTLQNPTKRLNYADGQERTIGKFPLENGHMVILYMNQYNPTSGIVSGYQRYEMFDTSDTLVETRTLDIHFKPISDAEVRTMISKTGMVIDKMFGDYSFGPFDEGSSDFMIYVLRKTGTL